MFTSHAPQLVSYLDGAKIWELIRLRGWTKRHLAKLSGLAPGTIGRLIEEDDLTAPITPDANAAKLQNQRTYMPRFKKTPISKLKGETIARLAKALSVSEPLLYTVVNVHPWFPLDLI